MIWELVGSFEREAATQNNNDYEQTCRPTRNALGQICIAMVDIGIELCWTWAAAIINQQRTTKPQKHCIHMVTGLTIANIMNIASRRAFWCTNSCLFMVLHFFGG